MTGAAEAGKARANGLVNGYHLPADQRVAASGQVRMVEVPTRGLRLRHAREALPLFALVELPSEPTTPLQKPTTPLREHTGLAALAERLALPLVRVDLQGSSATQHQQAWLLAQVGWGLLLCSRPLGIESRIKPKILTLKR